MAPSKPRLQVRRLDKPAGPERRDVDKLLALIDSGRLGEAVDLALSLARRFPRHDFARKVLGQLYERLGNYPAALVQKQRILTLSPGDPDACFNLANLLRKLDRKGEAATFYVRSLRVRTESEVAHSNLGLTLHECGDHAGAQACYRRVLGLRPDSAETHCYQGNVLSDLGEWDRAEAAYRRALRINPDAVEVNNNLAHALVQLSRSEEAESCYRAALKLAPQQKEALHGLGNLFMERGCPAEATTLYRRALNVEPADMSIRFSLASSTKVERGDGNFAALLEAAAAEKDEPSLSGENRTFMHYALGKCHADVGEHEPAFQHFAAGAKLRRAAFDYASDRLSRFFTEIMSALDPETVLRLTGAGEPSRLPIFVLGMPRSGTTLVEQTLTCHPDVHGAGELHDLAAIVRREIPSAGASLPYPGNLRALDRNTLARWGAEYVSRLRRLAPEAGRVTDKMPENFMSLGLIHLMLPQAKIIHVKRDPVDTCLSCFTNLFTFGHEHTYDLAELGHYYADYVRLMDHWRKVLPAGAFLDVVYEDLVADHETQTRRMIEYCQLEWNDACLAPQLNKRVVRTASLTQVRQPVYRSSMGRWKKYESFLLPLLDALGPLVPRSQ